MDDEELHKQMLTVQAEWLATGVIAENLDGNGYCLTEQGSKRAMIILAGIPLNDRMLVMFHLREYWHNFDRLHGKI